MPMRILPALFVALLLVTACGKNPDARKSVAEDTLTAKAVADVDGAMADTQPPAAQAPAK